MNQDYANTALSHPLFRPPAAAALSHPLFPNRLWDMKQEHVLLFRGSHRRWLGRHTPRLLLRHGARPRRQEEHGPPSSPAMAPLMPSPTSATSLPAAHESPRRSWSLLAPARPWPLLAPCPVYAMISRAAGRDPQCRAATTQHEIRTAVGVPLRIWCSAPVCLFVLSTISSSGRPERFLQSMRIIQRALILSFWVTASSRGFSQGVTFRFFSPVGMVTVVVLLSFGLFACGTSMGAALASATELKWSTDCFLLQF